MPANRGRAPESQDKATCTHLKATEYFVCSIPLAVGRRFIAQHHYSKGCSNTAVYMHGLFRARDNQLLGVAQWLPPTKVAAQSVNKDNWQQVLALSRLAVHPSVPTNGASFLMGRSIRLIQQANKWQTLVTYADDFMGHSGQIYKATNWEYLGRMKGSPRWEDGDGRQVARKSTVSRTDAQMRELGYVMVGSFDKHKFVKHLKIRNIPSLCGLEKDMRQGDLFVASQ